MTHNENSMKLNELYVVEFYGKSKNKYYCFCTSFTDIPQAHKRICRLRSATETITKQTASRGI